MINQKKKIHRASSPPAVLTGEAREAALKRMRARRGVQPPSRYQREAIERYKQTVAAGHVKVCRQCGKK